MATLHWPSHCTTPPHEPHELPVVAAQAPSVPTSLATSFDASLVFASGAPVSAAIVHTEVAVSHAAGAQQLSGDSEQAAPVAAHSGDPTSVAASASSTKSTATLALPLRCIASVTWTGGLATTVAVTGGSLTQLGAGDSSRTVAQAPPNARALNVTGPSGSAFIRKTVEAPTATSKLRVTLREPAAVIAMQVPSEGALVTAISALPVSSPPPPGFEPPRSR